MFVQVDKDYSIQAICSHPSRKEGERKNCAFTCLCVVGKEEGWRKGGFTQPQSDRESSNKQNKIKRTLITRTSELNTLSSHQQNSKRIQTSLICSLSRHLFLLPDSFLVFTHPLLMSKGARRKEGRTQRSTAPTNSNMGNQIIDPSTTSLHPYLLFK